MVRTDFSEQWSKIMIRYKRMGYNFNVMRQSVCCQFNPITVYLLFIYIFIQFHVPFKIISLIETNQSIGGAKREYPGKTT